MENHLKRIRLVFLAVALVSVLIGGVYTKPSSADRGKDIPTNIGQMPQIDPTISLTTLAKAINASGLAGTLKGKGPFTVFAPTDNAFSKLPSGTWDAVMNDQAKLKQFLMGLVVKGSLGTSSLSNGKKLQTLAGTTLVYKTFGPANNPAINDGTKDSVILKKTPMAASNGVIWILDGVPGL